MTEIEAAKNPSLQQTSGSWETTIYSINPKCRPKSQVSKTRKLREMFSKLQHQLFVKSAKSPALATKSEPSSYHSLWTALPLPRKLHIMQNVFNLLWLGDFLNQNTKFQKKNLAPMQMPGHLTRIRITLPPTQLQSSDPTEQAWYKIV